MDFEESGGSVRARFDGDQSEGCRLVQFSIPISHREVCHLNVKNQGSNAVKPQSKKG